MAYLPDEIVDQIVRELVPSTPNYLHANPKTLSRLSRVCKQWYRVVEPYLYLHIRAARPAKLVQTLIDNRHYGRWTKTLVASRTALTDPPDPRDEQLGGVPAHLSSKKKRKAYYNACLRYITPFLPNLEFLDVSSSKKLLDHHKGELPPWFTLITSSFDLNTPLFQHLKCLTAELHSLPVAELYAVFRLPLIETLLFTGGDMRPLSVDRTTMSRYDTGWSFRNLNLKTLSFKGPIPPDERNTFEYMAQSVPNIESLTFIGTKKRGGFGANMYRAITLDFLLQMANWGFKRLEMWDERTTKDNQQMAAKYTMAMRLFAFTTHTEEIVLDSSIVESLWDPVTAFVLLPPKLKRLHVRSSTGFSEHLVTPVVQMLLDLSEGLKEEEPRTYPELESVSVELQVVDRCSPGKLKKLERAFGEMGVRFEIRKKEDCPWTVWRALDEVFVMTTARRG